MAKFYMESGDVRMVAHAEHGRAAAIWAVHRAMCRWMPFLADEERRVPPAPHEPCALGETISIHEQGFGRTDGQTFDTFEIVTEWNRLMVALARLQTEFAEEATAV